MDGHFLVKVSDNLMQSKHFPVFILIISLLLMHVEILYAKTAFNNYKYG